MDTPSLSLPCSKLSATPKLSRTPSLAKPVLHLMHAQERHWRGEAIATGSGVSLGSNQDHTTLPNRQSVDTRRHIWLAVETIQRKAASTARAESPPISHQFKDSLE